MSKRKLLLADDSVTIQKVVNLTFTDEGFEVFTAGSGTAAMNMLGMIKPDLVLADVHMPGLTGYEVCEKIRQKSEFAELPVVLLVGSFEPFDEAEAARVGANDFLTKPFQSIRQLVQKVQGLIENPTMNLSGGDGEAASVDETSETDVENNLDAEDSIKVESAVAAVEPNVLSADSIGEIGDEKMDDQLIETSAGDDFSQTSEQKADETVSDESIFVSADDSSDETSGETSGDSLEDSFHSRPTAPLSFDGINSDEMPTETIEAETIEAEAVETEAFDADLGAEITDSESETSMPQNDIFPETEEAPFGEAPNQAFAFSADNAIADSAADFETIAAPSDEQTINFINADSGANAASANAESEQTTAFADFDFDFDGDSLLDLGEEPASAAEPTLEPEENAAPSAVEAMPPAAHDLSQNNDTALVQVNSNQMQAANLSNLQFPPEIIDAIAQRVVERLSDKVIEKIAWEVVPDRFDLIVRKHINSRER